MSKPERVIDTKTSIGIMLTVMAIPLAIGVLGATLGSKYESSCTAVKGEEPVCTSHYQYGGVDIPQVNLSAIAAAIGVGFGIYSGFKNGKIPEQFKSMLGGEDENDLPSSS